MRSVRFSAAWRATGFPALTEYGACTDCIQQWESWAEAVAIFTYNHTYVNNLSSRGPRRSVSAGVLNDQVNVVQALLEGWVQP